MNDAIPVSGRRNHYNKDATPGDCDGAPYLLFPNLATRRAVSRRLGLGGSEPPPPAQNAILAAHLRPTLVAVERGRRRYLSAQLTRATHA